MFIFITLHAMIFVLDNLLDFLLAVLLELAALVVLGLELRRQFLRFV